MKNKQIKIAVIGQGYVGLNLAVEFGKLFSTIGYDRNKKKIELLKLGIDKTNEISKSEINKSEKLRFSSKIESIKNCNIYVVAVPTPVDRHKVPNLELLKKASKIIGEILKKDNIVIFESTVYPGCTEEICVPLLEKHSNLKFNIDFFCGYSPERIVIGKNKKKLTEIVKITSGSNKKTAKLVDDLYKTIIKSGTFKAASIKVAEASKLLENTQRDLNISLMNEFSIICNNLNIDTYDVLDAAETKWNFHRYNPGFVGGHCISVDPYYLTYISKTRGFTPLTISQARKLNESMPKYVAEKFIYHLKEKIDDMNKCNILILGITYKENCSDTRDSKVLNLYDHLKKVGMKIDVYDYEADKKIVWEEFGIRLVHKIKSKYDGIILTVAHEKFNYIDIKSLKKDSKSVVFDLKGFFEKKYVDFRF